MFIVGKKSKKSHFIKIYFLRKKMTPNINFDIRKHYYIVTLLYDYLFVIIRFF